VPPVLDPEPELTPSDVKVVEIVPPNDDWDANVLARPLLTAPMVGQVLRGARIAVRGELQVQNARGCPTQLYYALVPFGWICSSEAHKSLGAPTTEQVLQVPEGSSLPYVYVMVAAAEGTFLPMWSNLEALHSHEDPERQLKRGDTIAVRPRLERFEDESYWVAVDDKVVPVKGTFTLKTFSDWQGVELNEQTRLPFAWVTPKNAKVFDAPKGRGADEPKGQEIDELPRRSRVDVLEERVLGKVRWIRIGEGRWMKADQLNEVRKIDRPASTAANPQWLDVDLGEQVLVAYRDDKPVYATLISSGREPNHTPRGDYPIWGKVTAITMKSQEYDDLPYYVNKVPWVLFFQAHNAFHGAYWHDMFGVVKSHGCSNLAPRDARYLFEWLQPKLPAGWTAVRFWDLSLAPVAHVHNSARPRDFFQERNVGPPDKNDEAERLDLALARREAKEREEEAAKAAAALAPGGVPGGQVGTAVNAATVPNGVARPNGVIPNAPASPNAATAPNAFPSSKPFALPSTTVAPRPVAPPQASPAPAQVLPIAPVRPAVPLR
jgi:hypothetical protein